MTRRLSDLRTSYRAIVLAVLAVAASTGACDRPVATSLADLDGCPIAMHGRRVTVEGYLGVNRREGTLVRGNDKGRRFYLLGLTADPGAQSTVSAAVDAGPNANQMDDLPDGDLSTSDEASRARMSGALQFHTSDGGTVGPERRVRVTGTFGAACILRVETIDPL